MASLSCTLPVFLAVVASTFTRTGLATGTVTFLAYGAGVSLVLMTLTIALGHKLSLSPAVKNDVGRRRQRALHPTPCAAPSWERAASAAAPPRCGHGPVTTH